MLPTSIQQWPVQFAVSRDRLASFRILYALFALIVMVPGHGPHASFTTYARFPDVFFVPPPGPMSLIGGFPSVFFFEALHLLLCVGLVAVLLGYRTKSSTLAVALLWTTGFGFAYSIGKINHNILFVLIPWLMAFSGWGAAFSIDSLEKKGQATSAWPLALLALFTGFAFFSAGFSKLIGGWLDPSTHATYGHLVNQFFAHDRQDLLAAYFIQFNLYAFWVALDYITVFFEIGFLFAALHLKSLKWFAALALCFHAGVLLMMNISFLFNLIVYAAFFDTRLILQPLRKVRLPIKLTGWLMAVFIILLGIASYVGGAVLQPLFSQPTTFTSDLTYTDVLILTGAAVAAFGWMSIRLFWIIREQSSTLSTTWN